jgi:hypothetical protein
VDLFNPAFSNISFSKFSQATSNSSVPYESCQSDRCCRSKRAMNQLMFKYPTFIHMLLQSIGRFNMLCSNLYGAPSSWESNANAAMVLR